MKVGELIERIQSLYSKGVASQSVRLSDELIYNKLITTRSLLLIREVRKKRKIGEWNYQTLPCIEMIPSSIIDCECLRDPNCKVLRSKYQLPKPLFNENYRLIKPITSVNSKIVFTETTFEELKYEDGNKFTKNIPKTFIRNRFLYAINIRSIKVLTLTGLFEDPVEVENFPEYCSNKEGDKKKCINPYDVEISIDSYLIDYLVNLTIKELLDPFLKMKEDLNNDNVDNKI